MMMQHPLCDGFDECAKSVRKAAASLNEFVVTLRSDNVILLVFIRNQFD